jgi:hypothetical protein
MSEEQSLQEESAEVVETPEVDESQSKPEEDDKETEKDDTEQGESKGEDDKPLSKADKIKQAMQKRIDRQTAAKHAQAEQIAKLQAEVQQLAQYKPKEEQSPQESDFETWEDYQEAVVEHKAEQKLKQRMEEQKQQQLQQAQAKQAKLQQDAFIKKVETFRSENPDYDEKEKIAEDALKDVQFRYGSNNATLKRIQDDTLDSDMTAEIIYEIGNNPDLLDDLMELSPAQAARKLYSIEQSLQSNPVDEDPLPKPIKSTKGAGKAVKPLHQRDGKDVLAWVNS